MKRSHYPVLAIASFIATGLAIGCQMPTNSGLQAGIEAEYQRPKIVVTMGEMQPPKGANFSIVLKFEKDGTFRTQSLAGIEKLTFKVTGANLSAPLIGEVTKDAFSNDKATISFTKLRPGMVDIAINALDAAGNVISYATGTAEIKPGQVTEVVLRCILSDGSLRIIYDCCDPTPIPQIIGGNTSIAAGTGIAGYTDGASSSAQFRYPIDVVVDSFGNAYVSDYYNNVIRKIAPTGDVSTLAGNGSIGYANGSTNAAMFYYPAGLGVDFDGNILVADYYNNCIRRVTLNGVVSTVAGNGSRGISDGATSSAQFSGPYDVVSDKMGDLYVSDMDGATIRKIDAYGNVTTFAGNRLYGFVDGIGASASFNFPSGLAVDSKNNLFVADTRNHRIRRITPDGAVSTFAGSGVAASTDGATSSASFMYPKGLAIDPYDNVYVTEGEYSLATGATSSNIRKITPDGIVTTLAGGSTRGYQEGTGSSALFNAPYGIGLDSVFNRIYIADTVNHRVRLLK